VTGAGQSACAGSGEHVLWTVRDLDGKVLRIWDQRFQADGWTWIEDSIFRDGQPLATLLDDGNGNDDPPPPPPRPPRNPRAQSPTSPAPKSPSTDASPSEKKLCVMTWE